MASENVSARLVEIEAMLDRSRRRFEEGIRSTAGDPDTGVVDKGAATQSILAAQPSDSDLATAQVPQQ